MEWEVVKGDGEPEENGQDAGRAPHTCVLGQAGTVAVALGNRDTMLGAHSAPVRS